MFHTSPTHSQSVLQRISAAPTPVEKQRTTSPALTLFGEEADGLVHAAPLGADVALGVSTHAGDLRLGQRHLAGVTVSDQYLHTLSSETGGQ